MGEPLDTSNILNSLRGQADKAAGISPFAPGEGIAAGIDLLTGLSEPDKPAGDFIKVKELFNNALSKTSVFGQKLGSGGFNLGSRLAKDLWTHKGEIAAGAAGGAAAKTAMRLLLAGSGGVVPAMLIGAAGGAASGALKEYWKQRGSLEIEEAGNKLVIDGLRNEFRRIGASDKEKIGKAALRGAAFGVAGALLSDAIAENEWVQQQFAKISMPQFGGPSVPQPATEATATPTATAEPTMTPTKAPAMTPTAEATPTPKPPTPTPTPVPPPPEPAVPSTVVPPAPEAPPVTPQAAPPLEISPEIAKMPAALELPAGSNPWDEVSGYGEKYLGRPLINAEKLLLTKELCKQSGIAVPVWGLNEGIDHTKLPVGFKLIFNDPVKKLLEELKAA